MGSARSHFKREDKESTIQYFFSSFLSLCLNESIGYEIITIIISLINFLTFFFGFTKFEFILEWNHYENYPLN